MGALDTVSNLLNSMVSLEDEAPKPRLSVFLGEMLSSAAAEGLIAGGIVLRNRRFRPFVKPKTTRSRLMVQCAKCEEDVQADFEFCPACGAENVYKIED